MLQFLLTAGKRTTGAFSTKTISRGISSEMQALLDLFQKKQSLQSEIEEDSQALLTARVLENDTRYRANQTILGLQLHQMALKERLEHDQKSMQELECQIQETQAKVPEFRNK